MMAATGEIVTSPRGFLCTTKLDLRFRGKPAHAGVEPQLGRNALAAACHAVTQLLGISRHGGGMTRINVGEMRAGEGRNVIPVNAELKLEVRGETAEINQYMVDQVGAIAEGVARSFGVAFEIEKMGEAVDLANDAALVDVIAERRRSRCPRSARSPRPPISAAARTRRSSPAGSRRTAARRRTSSSAAPARPDTTRPSSTSTRRRCRSVSSSSRGCCCASRRGAEPAPRSPAFAPASNRGRGARSGPWRCAFEQEREVLRRGDLAGVEAVAEHAALVRPDQAQRAVVDDEAGAFPQPRDPRVPD